MPEKLWVVSVVVFLHDLFTVVWVGGMIALGFGVLPAVRRSLGMGPQTQALVSAFQRGYRWVAAVSIVGLAATGIVLSQRSPEFQTWFSWADTYSVMLSLKHLLVIAMVLLVIARSAMMPRPAAQGGTRPPGGGAPAQPAGRARTAVLLLYVNILLGVAVLFLSAATTTLGAA